jgi:ATP-binding cassette, subfamily B, bacterial
MSALGTYLERLPSLSRAETPQFAAAGRTDSFKAQLRGAGLPTLAAALLVAHAGQIALWLLSWRLIGAGVLDGRLDNAWVVAWALALAGTVPLASCSSWLQGLVAIGFGGLLKQRLLAGAMAADIDYLRRRGAGELMSEVLESEAIDEVFSSGGLAMTLAAVELLVTPCLLGFGTAGGWEAAILVLWCLLLAAVMSNNFMHRWDWTKARIALTDKLVEVMMAHRTRTAQEDPKRWHRTEDLNLEHYLSFSRSLDRGTALIESLMPRGYLIVAFIVMLPDFLRDPPRIAALAVSFGSILFATSSFERFCFGYSRVAGAVIAWRIVRPVFDNASREPLAPVAEGMSIGAQRDLLKVGDVRFAHGGRQDSVLSGCNLTLRPGDRVLLEGSSGSGKSTFAAILAGMRAPAEGFVLSTGLDRFTLGDRAWRQRVALAPQYHENHIMAAPLLFNLLMSRPQPYGQTDFDEAEEVCRDLGLGDLLARMPAGLHQFVGDTGWRLSQGERSRIYLARALLQRAEVLVLDESLAALDPENLTQCLNCIMRRAGALVLIAHP